MLGAAVRRVTASMLKVRTELVGFPIGVAAGGLVSGWDVFWMGGGTLWTEPVLVSFHGGQFSSRIYDQEGNLLASGAKAKEFGHSRLRRWLDLDGTQFFDAQGRAMARVRRDRAWNPGLVRVSAEARGVLGEVSLVEKSLHSASDGIVGYVRGSGRWRRASPRFELQDASGSVLGHVTRTEGAGWTWCNVIEFGEHGTGPLRQAVLAIDAAVNYWLRSKGR